MGWLWTEDSVGGTPTGATGTVALPGKVTNAKDDLLVVRGSRAAARPYDTADRSNVKMPPALDITGLSLGTMAFGD